MEGVEVMETSLRKAGEDLCSHSCRAAGKQHRVRMWDGEGCCSLTKNCGTVNQGEGVCANP